MSTPSRPRRTPRRNSALEKLVLAALDEMKAVNIKLLDVRGLTDFADTMIVASGNSDRHVRAIAQHVIDQAKAGRHRPFGVEGARDAEWVLVDLQDVVVHVMLPRVREFYAIEQLWEPRATSHSAGVTAPVAKTTPPKKAVRRTRPRRVRTATQ
ncbi:MAG: ribosome silencing factor [Steroidobacteraceae bacterium]